MATQVEVRGLKELYLKFDQLGEAGWAVLQKAALAGAMIIRDEANRRAPGPNIEIKMVKQSKLSVEMAVGPEKKYWYYQFAELGATAHELVPREAKRLFYGGPGRFLSKKSARHPGMPARPFLRPALDNNVDKIVDAVGAVIKESIEAVTRGA